MMSMVVTAVMRAVVGVVMPGVVMAVVMMMAVVLVVAMAVLTGVIVVPLTTATFSEPTPLCSALAHWAPILPTAIPIGQQRLCLQEETLCD